MSGKPDFHDINSRQPAKSWHSPKLAELDLSETKLAVGENSDGFEFS